MTCSLPAKMATDKQTPRPLTPIAEREAAGAEYADSCCWSPFDLSDLGRGALCYTPAMIEAAARGEEGVTPYTVTGSTCTCAHFTEGHKICKHIFGWRVRFQRPNRQARPAPAAEPFPVVVPRFRDENEFNTARDADFGN